MQIIYFEENQKNEWNEFIAENRLEGFLQSWEWGKFQKSLGRKIWRVGIINDGLSSENETNKSQIPNPKSQINSKSQIPGNFQLQTANYQLLAIALIVKYDFPFRKSYFYCPRGPAANKFKVQSSKFKVLDFLFEEIKKIAGKEGAMFLRFDPPLGLNDEFGIMNYEYLSNFKKTSNEIQPRNTLILDLAKSEEELLREMKQKTRYNIKLAERKELRITNYELRIDNRKIFEEKFKEFWELIKETSARDKFASHNKDYYWKMLEGLGEAQKAPQPFETMEPANEGDIRECRLRARLYFAEYENKIIASNIVLYFGGLAVYLHGASSNKYRNVMAPHLLQWRQILDAKNAGYEKYDFWGIARECQMSNVKCQMKSKFKNSWGGITRFKKGFGGEERNYIGAYDAVFDNIGYAAYKFIKFIRLYIVGSRW